MATREHEISSNSQSRKRRKIELKRGSKNKYMDEKNGIERINEAEFKSKSTHSLSKYARTYTQATMFVHEISSSSENRKRAQKRRKIELKHTKKGNKNRYMDEEDGIERISEAEFRSRSPNSSPKHARTYTQGNKNRYMDEEDGIERISEAEFRSRSPNSSPKHARTYTQEHDDEDESSQDEVAIIDKAEFMKCAKHSKAPLASNQEFDDRNVGNISKEATTPDSTTSGSDQAAPFLHKGNNHQDTDIEMVETERYDDFDDQRDNDNVDCDDDDDKSKDEPQTDRPLPLKFRFEEELEVMEKSKYEEMVESLFDEYNCALEELRCYNCPEVHLENALLEETQHARCTRGNHELVLQDDQGWFCVYCRHVALGPKYVLPSWVEKINFESIENQTYDFTSFQERGRYVDNHSMCERVRRLAKKENKAMDGHLWHPDRTPGIANRTRSKMRTIKGISQDCTPILDSTDDSFAFTGSESYSSIVEIKMDKSSHSHSNEIKFSGSYGAAHDTPSNISEMSGHCYKGGRRAAKHASKRELPTEHQDDRLDCSLHGFKRQKISERKLQAHDDFDHDDGHGNSSGNGHKRWRDLMGQILKKQTKGGKGSSKYHDICKILADSILEKNQILKTMQVDDPQSLDALQLRFKFEEEQQEQAKSETVWMMESLFDELDFCWELENVGSFNCPKDELDKSPTEETQYERCKRGKHELTLEDEQGLFCVYCGHVALGPKDVLPEWGKKNSGSGRRKWSGTEDLPDLDAFSSKSSLDNYIDLRSGTVWNIKPGIRESMYEHQQEGFEFLWRNLAGSINLAELQSMNPSGVGGCIISHAPGTGKTRLTIVFIESYLKFFPNCRPAIIAPAGMLLTWEEEFRKWNVNFPFHNLNNMELSGKENDAALELLTGARCENQETIRMVKIYSWNTGSSILGISYSLFEKLTGEKYMNEKRRKKVDNMTLDKKLGSLRKILLEKPGLVVLDEGHTPRNQRSNIWNVLQKLKTEKRIILSGTPFQNNFGELFNTLRIVRPAVADALAQEKPFAEMITSRRMSSSKHRENYCSTSISDVIDRAVEKLKISMSPFVHVHKGTILRKSLPGLRDCVVLLKPSPLQKAIIERLEGLQSTFKSEHEVALTSVHPYLFQHCDSTEEQKAGINMEAVEASKFNPNEGVKTKFVLEFARLSVAMNEKILIFSQYIQPLELIKEQMKEVFKWAEGKEILQLHGRLDQKQRQILINIFNDPQSESKIMLASTRCCSEGISLVGASRVIILDVVWNPSVERQAICRAYRIGQKKFVHTYHLMTSGTTEADKYCRQAEKERLSELVFSSTNESNLQKHNVMGFEDMILEEMVAHEKLKEMFEKIINQPKDTDLIHSFGLTT